MKKGKVMLFSFQISPHLLQLNTNNDSNCCHPPGGRGQGACGVRQCRHEPLRRRDPAQVVLRIRPILDRLLELGRFSHHSRLVGGSTKIVSYQPLRWRLNM